MLALIVLSVQQVDAFLDEFERGKFGDDWAVDQNAPKNDLRGWSIDKGEVVYDPAKGANSRLMTGEQAWKDYTVECNIKFMTAANYPGGIRTYVDAKTGGHYAVWFYPPTKTIKLYSGTVFDINPGIVTLGEHVGVPYDAKEDVFYYVKVIHEGKQIEVWFGKSKDKAEKIIEAKDGKFKSGLFAFDGYNQPVHFDNILITGPGIPRSDGEAVESQDKLAIAWGILKSNKISK
jgi:hypothetical protein